MLYIDSTGTDEYRYKSSMRVLKRDFSFLWVVRMDPLACLRTFVFPLVSRPSWKVYFPCLPCGYLSAISPHLEALDNHYPIDRVSRRYHRRRRNYRYGSNAQAAQTGRAEAGTQHRREARDRPGTPVLVAASRGTGREARSLRPRQGVGTGDRLGEEGTGGRSLGAGLVDRLALGREVVGDRGRLGLGVEAYPPETRCRAVAAYHLACQGTGEAFRRGS